MSVALGLVNWRAVGMAIVRGRDVRQVEPPRATAALDAFLRVRRSGEAVDYDGDVKTFDFHSSPPIDA